MKQYHCQYQYHICIMLCFPLLLNMEKVTHCYLFWFSFQITFISKIRCKCVIVFAINTSCALRCALNYYETEFNWNSSIILELHQHQKDTLTYTLSTRFSQVICVYMGLGMDGDKIAFHFTKSIGGATVMLYLYYLNTGFVEQERTETDYLSHSLLNSTLNGKLSTYHWIVRPNLSWETRCAMINLMHEFEQEKSSKQNQLQLWCSLWYLLSNLHLRLRLRLRLRLPIPCHAEPSNFLIALYLSCNRKLIFNSINVLYSLSILPFSEYKINI